MISTALNWKMYAYISSEWVDISSDVLISGKAINATWGIRGNSEVDRMADTGVLSFSLNNVTGKYSPNLAGALAGWKKGIPIKLVFTFDGEEYVRFRGKVDRVDIDAGTSKQRQVSVTVTDWLDYAAEFPLVQPTIDTDKRADEAIDTIVTGMPIQPQATAYDTGANTFPVVFNAVTDKTRAYSEISKLVLSEMGYCYLKKDKTYGETLVFESETHRNGLHALTQVPINRSWTETRPAGDVDRYWEGVASDSDGSNLIAGDGARLWLSSNGGTSWTETRPAGDANWYWESVASDSDGSVLIAGITGGLGGRLWFSTNSGTSWTEARPAGDANKYWESVASDSDGSVLIAGDYGGRLWLSTDSGANWSEVRPAGNVNKNWRCVASNSDGSVLIAGVYNGRLWLSTDSGANWSEVRPAGDADKNWTCIASDSDGSNFIAGVWIGRLWLSTDSGANWSEVRPAGDADKNWRCVASDNDGSNLIAGSVGGRLWTSTNSGVSWSEVIPAGDADKTWQCVASDSDGSNLIAGSDDERLWTSALEYESVTLDNTMTDLDVEYGSNLINTMQFTAYPKEVDAAATTVLFKLNQPILLASGETQTLTARYTDPSGGGRKVNGMDMVTPAATTDYLFNTLQNGTGSNITANLTVTASYGAEGVTYTLTNGYSAQGYITKLQARGKGIYNYNSISYTAENDASCNEHGVISKNINQPYQVTLAQGTLKAEGIVMREKQPRTILDTVYFTANNSNKLMNAFLNIDVGDLVEIKESQTGIDGQYWVNGIEFGMVDGKVVEVRWYVKEQTTVGSGITLMACEFSPSGTVDALQYGVIPEADNLTQRTLSAWIYAHSVPGSASGHIFGAWGGDLTGYDIAANNGTCVHFQYSTGAAAGRWESPVNSLPLTEWTHIAATRDTSLSGTVAPIVYIGGTAQSLTEAVAPGTVVPDETGWRYIVGNIFTAAYEYNRPFDGLIKDARIYNRVLAEAEVQSLVAGGTVTDGLLFQGPAVYDTDVADFTDKTLAETDKVIEGITSRVGTPHGSPITRAIT